MTEATPMRERRVDPMKPGEWKMLSVGGIVMALGGAVDLLFVEPGKYRSPATWMAVGFAMQFVGEVGRDWTALREVSTSRWYLVGMGLVIVMLALKIWFA